MDTHLTWPHEFIYRQPMDNTPNIFLNLSSNPMSFSSIETSLWSFCSSDSPRILMPGWAEEPHGCSCDNPDHLVVWEKRPAPHRTEAHVTGSHLPPSPTTQPSHFLSIFITIQRNLSRLSSFVFMFTLSSQCWATWGHASLLLQKWLRC